MFWSGRRRRDALRRAMRGYRRLKELSRLGIADEASEMLTAEPLPIAQRQFSRLFFGASLAHAELATRQYLYLRQALYKLPPALLATAARPDGRLAYPLPVAWRDRLARAGFVLEQWPSRLSWGLAVLFYWAYGCLVILQVLLATARASLAGEPGWGRYAHFENINKTQTPRPAKDGRSFDVMSWYRSWPGRARDLTTLTYRVKRRNQGPAAGDVQQMSLPVIPVLGLTAYVGLLGWCAAAVCLSLAGLFRGRWWHALMLGEATLAELVRRVPETALARDYLFNNSGWLYRPLWSYEAEQRGSRILFYHYSTNSASMKRPDGYPPEHYTWAITNWPIHLVWDEEQAAFVKRAVGDARTEVVGPIWFTSMPEQVQPLPQRSIAVFDVQPFRPAKAPSISLDFNYYTPENCAAFLEDTSRAIGAINGTMVWKRKRDIGKGAHARYRALAARIDAEGNALVIAPDQSAVRIIEAVDAVVSMPFTSTALLARHLGKPSCYYDPLGLIEKQDRGAHDIPILVGYEDLHQWLRSLPHR